MSSLRGTKLALALAASLGAAGCVSGGYGYYDDVGYGGYYDDAYSQAPYYAGAYLARDGYHQRGSYYYNDRYPGYVFADTGYWAHNVWYPHGATVNVYRPGASYHPGSYHRGRNRDHDRHDHDRRDHDHERDHRSHERHDDDRRGAGRSHGRLPPAAAEAWRERHNSD